MVDFTAGDLPDLHGRTAIVTGANSGVGLATARALAIAGARVVLAVRSLDRGQAAARTITGDTEVRRLDLADLASVRAFAAAWTGPVDLLINNAGISVPDRRRTADGFELQFATNHLGPFALTNLLLEHVTDRIVTVSSQAERMGRLDLDDPDDERRPYRESAAYNRSKLANLLFTAELQRRLDAAGSRVRAVSAHPGLVQSAIYSESGAVLRLMVRLLGQSADEGALPVLYAAVADLPGDSFTGPSRWAHMRGAPQLINRSATARDAGLAARLWTLSERLTGTRFPLGHHFSTDPV
ncbi:oxidoreductase [Dactylosporangium matsuzakiense]|uniref:Short-chain dehydrogenase/reductase n=1 Tax=Dactylosporangium matsuzakiense TaxID=53360 RepID=A0A9W6KSS2_9ACTN|nr:oxidoreductase [Dactylosporangium matsuzakiense]UWZ49141.1 SDR family NAD(P)-dependent oxidoreductase [Dactylosporangium matsuzakiense]GLL06547.1 putative short-chain dehydrogenase/reductase [Dactylosporangium matsuzakiense]